MDTENIKQVESAIESRFDDAEKRKIYLEACRAIQESQLITEKQCNFFFDVEKDQFVIFGENKSIPLFDLNVTADGELLVSAEYNPATGEKKDVEKPFSEIPIEEIQIMAENEEIEEAVEEETEETVEEVEEVEEQTEEVETKPSESTSQNKTFEYTENNNYIFTNINEFREVITSGETLPPNASFTLVTIDDAAYKIETTETGELRFFIPESIRVDNEDPILDPANAEELMSKYNKGMSKAKIDPQTGEYVFKESSKELFNGFFSVSEGLTEMHIDQSVDEFQTDKFKEMVHFVVDKKLEHIENNTSLVVKNGKYSAEFFKKEDGTIDVTINNGEEVKNFTVSDKDDILNHIDQNVGNIDFLNLTNRVYLLKNETPLTPEEIAQGLHESYISYNGREGMGNDLAFTMNRFERDRIIAQQKLDILDNKKREILFNLDKNKGFLSRLFSKLFRPISMLFKRVFKIPLTPEQKALREIAAAKRDVYKDLELAEKSAKRLEKDFNIDIVEPQQDKQPAPQQPAPHQPAPHQPGHDERFASEHADDILGKPPKKEQEKSEEKPFEFNKLKLPQKLEKYMEIFPKPENCKTKFSFISKDTKDLAVTVQYGGKEYNYIYNPYQNKLQSNSQDRLPEEIENALKENITISNMLSARSDHSMFSPKYVERLQQEGKGNLMAALVAGETFEIKTNGHDIHLKQENGICTFTSAIDGHKKEYHFPFTNGDTKAILSAVENAEREYCVNAFKSKTRENFMIHMVNSPVISQTGVTFDNEGFIFNEGGNNIYFTINVNGVSIDCVFDTEKHTAMYDLDQEDELSKLSNPEEQIGPIFNAIENAYCYQCLCEFHLPAEKTVVSIDAFEAQLEQKILETINANDKNKSSTMFFNGLSYTITPTETGAFQLTAKDNRGLDVERAVVYQNGTQLSLGNASEKFYEATLSNMQNVAAQYAASYYTIKVKQLNQTKNQSSEAPSVADGVLDSSYELTGGSSSVDFSGKDQDNEQADEGVNRYDNDEDHEI